MLRWVPGSCTRTIRRCRVAHPLWVRRPPGENPRYGSRSVVASPDVHCGPRYPWTSPKTALNWSLLTVIPFATNTERIPTIDGECCGPRHTIRADPSTATISDPSRRVQSTRRPLSPLETRRVGHEGDDEGAYPPGRPYPAMLPPYVESFAIRTKSLVCGA
jgi:hypothetical protein